MHFIAAGCAKVHSEKKGGVQLTPINKNFMVPESNDELVENANK
ncbi:hypothetical protein [Mycoplasmopsis agalactiae]|nr:hypothetical protein [Mycoplasmopsis agalactiae]